MLLPKWFILCLKIVGFTPKGLGVCSERLGFSSKGLGFSSKGLGFSSNGPGFSFELERLNNLNDLAERAL